MYIVNSHADHLQALRSADAAFLDAAAAEDAQRHFSQRADYAPTPLYALPQLATELRVGSLHVKDEGQRLGLGSFKALGGSYAVVLLVLEEAGRRLGRRVGITQLQSREIRKVAAGMTVACASAGNHGRSVAAGAQLAGARAVIFVHAGVSDERVAAIARFGAEVVRVPGSYDDAVAEAARRCAEAGWLAVSDTSWPGYERIPRLVMQGYTVLVREGLAALQAPPTHVFVQAGVGGLAAAVAGSLSLQLGDRRPVVVVVEPARAACLLESARAGRPVRIARREPTVMAMLECYQPSLVAWGILSRAADGFMSVDEEDAVAVMRRLAQPQGSDPPIVAGESGGVGLAGLIRAAHDEALRGQLRIDTESRVFVINTEGATDPARYRQLVGVGPATRPGSTRTSRSAQ